MEDKDLVERARSGDRDAFGELVRRHRAKAYGWARSIAQDPHLADDIVQDALIRAFMHLGTLLDGERFIPWLQTIVRNQANMKLRRGGPFRKERPFTSFEVTAQQQREVQWDDLDSILHHMRTAAAAQAEVEGNPEETVLRKEILAMIHNLLHCLKRSSSSSCPHRRLPTCTAPSDAPDGRHCAFHAADGGADGELPQVCEKCARHGDPACSRGRGDDARLYVRARGV